MADTITLKTGEKLDGKVVSETDQDVTVEVKVSASITDERKIPKGEIEKIEKEQPDEIAWQALKNLKPGPNSMPAAQYDAVLRPLQAFVNEYPKSAHAADASQLLAIFAGEKERVDGGEVRLGEKWLSKEEVEKERYQISGLLIFQHMRSQRAAGDLIGVLNSFEQLERNYPGSKVFPDAVELTRETLATLKASVARLQQAFTEQKAQFEAGLANSSAAQKPELLAARQRELAQGEALVAAAEKAKIKWPMLAPRSDKNLDAIAKKIQPEIQRLTSLDVSKQRQSVQLAEQGQKELSDKNAAAQDAVTKALALWPNNELAKRLQPDAVALKNEAAAQARASAATAAETRATPTPAPVAATPRPKPKAAVIAQPEPEKEKSFFLTIGGMITIVVLLGVVLSGWTAYNKIRHRANDILE